VQITEAAEYRSLKIGASGVAAVEVMVTPAPEIVVRPAPIDWMLITLPTLKTPEGIVTVTGEAFEVVTNLPLSPATKV
jgi:hypothetical protein